MASCACLSICLSLEFTVLSFEALGCVKYVVRRLQGTDHTPGSEVSNKKSPGRGRSVAQQSEAPPLTKVCEKGRAHDSDIECESALHTSNSSSAPGLLHIIITIMTQSPY